jgi:hypothetical protein
MVLREVFELLPLPLYIDCSVFWMFMKHLNFGILRNMVFKVVLQVYCDCMCKNYFLDLYIF